MMNNPSIYLEGYRRLQSDQDQIEVYLKEVPQKGPELTEAKEWFQRILHALKDGHAPLESWLAEELSSRCGLFSMVIRHGEDYYIAGDIIRRYPLFYGFREGALFITNNLHQYQERNPPFVIDDQTLEEFVVSGSVFRNRTVYKDVFALQPGEILSIRDGKVHAKRYFEFRLRDPQPFYKDTEEFSEALDQTLLSVFSRMIAYTPHVNRWLISLSGGHDSRIIVNYLKRLGIDNVVCYTYGRSSSSQTDLSRQVAGALGYEWHVVQYTEQKWQELHNRGLIEGYINRAHNGVSTPHLQDFLAVNELIDKGIIQQGDVFVTGHTFDWLAGSNLCDRDLACANKKMAVNYVIQKHFRGARRTGQTLRSIENMYDELKIDPKYFQEYFNWQERRSKFMVNSLQGYEFLNFDSRLPFWDKELVEFWLRVPDKDRMGRKIFHEAEEAKLLLEALKSIPYSWKQDPAGKSKVENLLRSLLPGFMKTLLLRVSGRKVQYSEGLNQIYALRASTLEEMLSPVEHFPIHIRHYFKEFLKRYPYQIDYHFLSALLAIRNQLDRYVLD